MSELEQNRAQRLLTARLTVHPALWLTLIVGGIVTILFTYLFHLWHVWTHVAMTAGLAIMTARILVLIGALDQPFAGDVHVDPGAFQFFLDQHGP